MKPGCGILIIILLLLAGHSIGQHQGKAVTGITVIGNDRVREINDDFYYDIELFPGEEFSGYIYHWTEEGDAAYGELHENPEVDWLNVSPHLIFAEGCDEPVPVRFSFKAPQKEGKYSTVVEDYEYNWSDNIITLVVTSRPDSNMTDSLIITGSQAGTLYRYQQHRYSGLEVSQSWYDIGYCGQDPYVVSPTRQIARSVYPSWPGISFSPASFTLYLGDSQTVTKTFNMDENIPDSLIEAVYIQWKSYPYYIKWKIVSADIYCQGWKRIPSLEAPCLAAGAVIYRDSLFVIGGMDPFTKAATGRVEVLGEKSWQVLPGSLDGSRYGFSCGVLNDRIYVFGGMDGNHQPLNTVEYYDGSRWLTDPGSMPVKLGFHSGAVYGDSYYLFGGTTGSGRAYDHVLRKFSAGKGWVILHDPLPFTPRERYGCVVADSFIYIIGGMNIQGGPQDSTWFDEVFKYDIVADTFSMLSPMNHPRADFACGAAGGFIYAVGGTSSGPDVSSSAEFFDPAAGTWFSCEDTPDLSLISPAYVSKDENLFLLGGAIALPGGVPDYISCYGSDFFSGDGNLPEMPPLEMNVFPNPFLGEAMIDIYLPYDSRVRLALYGLDGRLIRKLADESLQAGNHAFTFEGSFLAEGLYFIQLRTGKQALARKMLKVKY